MNATQTQFDSAKVHAVASKYGLSFLTAKSYLDNGFELDSYVLTTSSINRFKMYVWLEANGYQVGVDYVYLPYGYPGDSWPETVSTLFKDGELATLVKLKYG